MKRLILAAVFAVMISTGCSRHEVDDTFYKGSYVNLVVVESVGHDFDDETLVLKDTYTGTYYLYRKYGYSSFMTQIEVPEKFKD